jgi:hypothetical protein
VLKCEVHAGLLEGKILRPLVKAVPCMVHGTA